MKKIAVFVEGSTEAIFIEWLVKNAAPKTSKVVINHQEVKGKKGKRVLAPIRIIGSNSVPTHYIQIINSSSDDMVKSDIIEQSPSLGNSGFSEIIGLRDLFPISNVDLAKIEENLMQGLPAIMPTKIYLAVMETEAWFIAEHTHFSRISKLIRYSTIKKREGIDVKTCNVESIPHPAKTLDRIYRIGFKRYQKRHNEVYRSLNAFNYNFYKNEIGPRFPRLNYLLCHIETMLN